VDQRPIPPDRIRKLIGAENTFAVDLTELSAMQAELRPLVAKVWTACERTRVRGRTVMLKVKYNDFQQITRSASGAGGVSSCGELAPILFTLQSEWRR